MKPIFTLIFLAAFLSSLIVMADNPRAYFAYNTFMLPENGPYLETYLQFDASSLKFVEADNQQLQASVEILMIFKQDDKIREFSKYELKSPPVDDVTDVNFFFTDQQRFILPSGEYLLELSITDLNNPSGSANHVENISINPKTSEVSVSSIQLAETIEKAETPGPLTKSGYNIYPYVDYFYPSSVNNISYYTEIYNTSKKLGDDEGFLVVSTIESFETRRLIPDFVRYKRESARQTIVLLSSFDISNLPSGNYYLVVSVRSRTNDTLASNLVFFQRSNPGLKLSPEQFQHISLTNSFAELIINQDSLSYFIKALSPISSYTEREFAYNLSNSGDMRTMQQYFYNFWTNRDPLQPELAWKNYYIQMCRADANFKTRIKRGHETDRGRVYLQYGPPNSINKSYEEPAAYPHEIWHYYEINGQRNRRFVFYTHDITTNDFDLIHSEMIGEINNPRWMTVINSRREGWELDYDAEMSRPWNRTWGSRTLDYYHDPR
jgi:GWxTD domain-containing protein